MLFSSCLPWKTLVFLSLAVLLADFPEIRAFASQSECKSATIDDVIESLEVRDGCIGCPRACSAHNSCAVCRQLPPCPLAQAPRNGGLVCVTIDSAQYCKPMCNKGYDFQFLRRSRLYEVCGNDTEFSWTTQLVGEKALAVCNPSEMAISGAKSAYFPSNSTCLHTLAFTETQREQLDIFLKELAEQGIDGSKRDEEADCIICGY